MLVEVRVYSHVRFSTSPRMNDRLDRALSGNNREYLFIIQSEMNTLEKISTYSQDTIFFIFNGHFQRSFQVIIQ